MHKIICQRCDQETMAVKQGPSWMCGSCKAVLPALTCWACTEPVEALLAYRYGNNWVCPKCFEGLEMAYHVNTLNECVEGSRHKSQEPNLTGKEKAFHEDFLKQWGP